ncbi:BlaI/MecI/CopY family transcriptional regulator [Streptomyces fractus]|uniref:BlaI/MecI/CopY family transcriptional regulator n=1 Tax=Streptomyces fractus TaxID=641806 RepID=UPI003CE69BC4
MGAQEELPGPEGRRRANGALEGEILTVLHAAGQPLTPGEVCERLTRSPAHTTVATTLARLQTRGLLERSPRGRSYTYAPVADESGLTARHMHTVMTQGQDRTSVLTHFVGELSDDDEELLRALLGSGE